MLKLKEKTKITIVGKIIREWNCFLESIASSFNEILIKEDYQACSIKIDILIIQASGCKVKSFKINCNKCN